MFDRFFSTLSMVSRIPFKAQFTFDPSRIDFYLPITGIFPALMGILVFGGVLFITGNPLITILIVLVCQYLGFNLFHLDGLADTADAFLGTFEREKRFAILKDSRVGTYGLFAGVTLLSLKAAFLYTLVPFISLFPAGILAYPISGRFSAALIPCISSPAKPDGLGILVKDSSRWRCAGGLLISLFLWTALIWGSFTLAIPVFPDAADIPLIRGAFLPDLILLVLPLTGPLVSLAITRLYRNYLGGYTGDALGAAVELAELLHLAGAFLILRIL